MKKSRNNFSKILVISLIIALQGCDKFKLLKDEDMEYVSAGANTQNITFAAFIRSNDYQQSDRYSILKQYAKAVRKAGLEALLDDASKHFTIVAFTDVAMNAYISSLGYSGIDDVPSEVLRNFILNNIIGDGKYQVIDFPENIDKGFQSLAGDSVFFRRENTTGNPYVLMINSTNRFASAGVAVRSRDLPYKNAVAHVLNSYTYTAFPKVDPDKIPDDLPVQKDSVFVTKDVVLQFAATEAGYAVQNPSTDDFQSKMASTINNTATRRLYLQFPVRQPNFSERLGNVTLKTYCTKIANAGSVLSNTINIYKDAYTNWEESPLPTYARLPVRSDEIISSFEIATVNGAAKWYGTNISSAFKQSLTDNQTFINIGIWNYSSPNVYFGHIGFSAGKYKSYILFESSPLPLIKNVTVTPLTVNSSDFYKVITKENLSASGVSDKNVNYILLQAPQKGIILCNGKPLGKGGIFTQQQLAQGAVRYLCNLQAKNTSDEIKIEAKDYRGGYYSGELTLPVIIN